MALPRALASVIRTSQAALFRPSPFLLVNQRFSLPNSLAAGALPLVTPVSSMFNVSERGFATAAAGGKRKNVKAGAEGVDDAPAKPKSKKGRSSSKSKSAKRRASSKGSKKAKKASKGGSTKRASGKRGSGKRASGKKASGKKKSSAKKKAASKKASAKAKMQAQRAARKLRQKEVKEEKKARARERKEAARERAAAKAEEKRERKALQREKKLERLERQKLERAEKRERQVERNRARREKLKLDEQYQRAKAKEKAKKLRRRKKDGEPTRPRTAFVFYVKEGFQGEKASGKSATEIIKSLRAKFDGLSADQKAAYEKKAEADKERYHKEKEEWQKAHPPKPKKPATGYLRWANEQRPALIKEKPELAKNVKEVGKLLGQRWQSLSESERESFNAAANAELEKYKSVLEQWEARHGQTVQM